MLPERLLGYDRTPDRRLVPRWLCADDDVWLRELVAVIGTAPGTAVGDAEQTIVDVASERARPHGTPRRLVEAVWTVERKRWRTRTDAKVPPMKIRRVLFDLAAERERDEAIATAAKELALEPAEMLATLFADRPDARLLVPPAAAATAGELRDRYNLILAQSLLVHSSLVIAKVQAHARRVVGQARRFRLLVGVTETDDGALRVVISGPLALFHDTLKYGRALAAWLPALLATPDWLLACRVILGGEAYQLDLDPSAPLATTAPPVTTFDGTLEERLARDLRLRDAPWRLERDSAAIRCGRELFFPDLTLVDGEGRRVAVEIAGFWTPAYLAAKTKLLATAECPVVVCADERRGGALRATGPNVIGFVGTIDVGALLDACEAALAGARRRPL